NVATPENGDDLSDWLNADVADRKQRHGRVWDEFQGELGVFDRRPDVKFVVHNWPEGRVRTTPVDTIALRWRPGLFEILICKDMQRWPFGLYRAYLVTLAIVFATRAEGDDGVTAVSLADRGTGEALALDS